MHVCPRVLPRECVVSSRPIASRLVGEENAPPIRDAYPGDYRRVIIPRGRPGVIAKERRSNIEMFKWAQAMLLRAAALPGIVETHKAIVGLVYLAAYVALDRVSFIQPHTSF